MDSTPPARAMETWFSAGARSLSLVRDEGDERDERDGMMAVRNTLSAMRVHERDEPREYYVS